MIQRLVTLIIVLLITNHLFAQRETVWVFGNKAGVDFRDLNNPQPINTAITSGWAEASASVCDDQDRVLFYTNGEEVWDRNNNLMQNGSNLVPSMITSTSQGCLIVPVPAKNKQYYIFSLSALEHWSVFNKPSEYGRLYYTIVNMEGNNGLGEVMESTKGVLLDSFLTEAMIAVGGDQCNFWLIAYDRKNKGFKSFNINQNGISNPLFSPSGLIFNESIAGKIKVSNSGKKIVITCAPGSSLPNSTTLALFDFDRSSGQVVNGMELSTSSQSFYDAAFSPDDSKLYVTTGKVPFSIFQYNLNFQDPTLVAGSQKLIAENNFFTSIKSAPDKKLYFLTDAFTLGCINYPNDFFPACEYNSNAIKLIQGTSSPQGGLPNDLPRYMIKDSVKNVINIERCFADFVSINLDSNLVSNALWDNGSESYTREIDSSGIYWATYQRLDNKCMVIIDTFKVSIAGQLPQIVTAASCHNQADGIAHIVSRLGDTAIYMLSWTDEEGNILSVTDTLSDIKPGKYFLKLQIGNCDTILPVIISNLDENASFIVDSIACENQSVDFKNTSSSYFNSFLWEMGDSIFLENRNVTHQYQRSGIYEVSLIAKGDKCIDTFRKTVEVDARILPKFVKSKDSICIGEEIAFERDSHEAMKSEWHLGKLIFTTAGPNNITHSFDQSGLNLIKLNTYFRACPDTSFTDSIYVSALPAVDLRQEGNLCIGGTAPILKNHHEQNKGNYLYSWNTGDTTDYLRITHPGIYSLTLRDTVLGCSTTEFIEVKKDCYIDIPNAFTPDGDGINDYFFPRQLLSGSLSYFRMQIFNRWGQVLFETSNIHGRGWDGNFNNQIQPQGVYLYIIEAEFNNGRREHYKGNVTLIR